MILNRKFKFLQVINVICFLLLIQVGLQAQQPRVEVKEVERIMRVLAADEMMGRKTFSPQIDVAADFLAAEFKKAGLQPMPGDNDFLQSFSMLRTKQLSLKGEINDEEIPADRIIVVSPEKELKVDEKSGFEVRKIGAGASLGSEARKALAANKNLLVLVDESFLPNFNQLNRVKSNQTKTPHHVVFLFTNQEPREWKVKMEQEVTEMKLNNVVGWLPGKSRKEELVIFSAHYDHIGVGRAVDGDSIYNGANDDAAGTTAVVMLANHFAQLGAQERSLVFAAFTAEEIGGFGSQYFSRQLDPQKVMAMINIEMIGTESKWGRNSAFITGYEQTDLGKMLEKNLEGSSFRFHPDPYPTQQLFYRSDNATLARLGVPAHTVSTAKMENEPHYHKVSDEVETLDLENMARIIEAIAISTRGIVKGTDTPSRVDTSKLR